MVFDGKEERKIFNVFMYPPLICSSIHCMHHKDFDIKMSKMIIVIWPIDGKLPDFCSLLFVLFSTGDIDGK